MIALQSLLRMLRGPGHRRCAIAGRRITTALLILLTGGCHWQSDVKFSDSYSNYRTVATEIEYPDAHIHPDELIHATEHPNTLRHLDDKPFWDLLLEDAIQIALRNSPVMRDIGGRVVVAPQGVITTLDPAIQETSPVTGTEAALSDFDAQLNTSLLLSHTERTFNNIFAGAGATGFKATTGEFLAGITKRSAAG